MTRILIIYTGGTIGMVHDPVQNTLRPFDFEKITAQVPELSRFDYRLSVHSFTPLIDSSDIQPRIWTELAGVIYHNYADYDGFVILHGTDTMSYTASALSFMLENLDKPVILTGSQLPIGEIRTDAKENLITSIEIASARKNGRPLINEVCIFFDYRLFRGNRSSKFSSSKFEAFHSPNYPVLAEAGVHIEYYEQQMLPAASGALEVSRALDPDIAVLKLFPGIGEEFVRCVLGTKGLKGLVLETFGSGNAPTSGWFIEALRTAVEKGLIIYNVTQCSAGAVEQGRYETSRKLKEIGVTGGADITTEAAVTKMMYLLGREKHPAEVKRLLQTALRGEMTTEL
jgi:L-asparaginase